MRRWPVRLVLVLVGVQLGIAGISAGSVTAAPADDYFGFLKSVYDQQDKRLGDYLEAELANFIRLYPQSQRVAEARYLRARVIAELKDEHHAFTLFMKTLFLHPEGTAHERAAEGARVIVTTNRSYKDRRNELTLRINGDFAAGSNVDLHYAYIAFLHDFGLDKMRRWALVEFGEFVALYPSDQRAGKVQYWIGDGYATEKKYREAAASYLKFDYLYPNSSLVPAVRVQRAGILNEKLGQAEQAVTTLTTVVEDYPQTVAAGTALLARARIKAARFKDYNGAIADYEQLVGEMPTHTYADEALFEMAEIYAGKRKDYRSAVTSYEQIVTSYPQNRRCIPALEKAAKIYLDKLRQPVSAADSYARIAQLFPEYEKSPDMLLRAADICEKKAKIIDQALAYYEQVVADYPQTEQATKAQKKIVKLQQQPGS